MRNLVKENGAEALIGLLVILLAVWFGIYAWGRTGGGEGTSGAIHITAQFPNVSGVNVGTDVKIAGIKVGQVTGVKLDPKTYQAEVALALDPKAKVPDDSSAAITSEGILGGTYMALMPGGSPTPLKNGDVIIDTQGSMDLMSLVGQFINKSGGSGSNASGGSSGADGNASAASHP